MDKNLSLARHDTAREAALAALRASVAAHDALEGVIAQQVCVCRRYDVGWQEVADLTHVSKPTAISRWKEEEEEEDEMETPTPTTWTLKPGDTIRRINLHRVFGGSGQPGIAPSRKSDEIL